ncbi:MAG: proton-conducting transporter membrane subunit [Bacillota bacterium]
MMVEHFPVLIIVLPLAGAFLMPLLARRQVKLCWPALLLILVLVLGMAVTLLWRLDSSGPYFYHLGGWPPPWGIELQVDFLRVYLLLVVLGLGLWIAVYAWRDLEHELKPELIGWYCALYALLIGSMAGIALTNDLFNLFVFMEICAIASCAVITIKETRECLEAGFKYLILSAMGTGCYLLAVALIYMVTGHLNFALVREALPEAAALYPNNVLAAAALIIVAFAVKAALFPLHVWLPDAHAAAPSPSSAVLSGVVIKIYAFALLILFYRVLPGSLLSAVPLNEVILWLSVLGIVFGSIFAMVQEDLKKMLAYSSIAQIGYVFLGIGLANRTALVGALYHLLNHGIMKALLFMAAGNIIHAAGLRRIKSLSGIGPKMPLTMLPFAVAGASMIGIPGTGGLIGKWFLALGALETGRLLIVIIIIAGSLLNAIYYLPIIINAYLNPLSEGVSFKPVPRLMTASLLAGAAAVIFFGVFSKPVVLLLERAVTGFF